MQKWHFYIPSFPNNTWPNLNKEEGAFILLIVNHHNCIFQPHYDGLNLHLLFLNKYILPSFFQSSSTLDM
jgi:hypothetical protein